MPDVRPAGAPWTMPRRVNHMEPDVQEPVANSLPDDAYYVRYDAFRDDLLPLLDQVGNIIAKYPEPDLKASTDWLRLVSLQLIMLGGADYAVMELMDFNVMILKPIIDLAYECSADKRELEEELAKNAAGDAAAQQNPAP